MWNTIKTSPAVRFLMLPLVAGITWYGQDFLRSNQQPTWTPPPAAWTAGPVATAAPAGKIVEKEFVVVSTYTTKNGLALLNETTDYTDPNAVTAVVSLQRFGQVTGPDPSALVGKTVRVKGRSSTYKGKPQILVDALTVK